MDERGAGLATKGISTGLKGLVYWGNPSNQRSVESDKSMMRFSASSSVAWRRYRRGRRAPLVSEDGQSCNESFFRSNRIVDSLHKSESVDHGYSHS